VTDSEVSITHDGKSGVHVVITGIVSEDFDPSAIPLDAIGPTAPLTINLRALVRFSSSGVREWLYFVRKVPPGSLRLEECSVGFVQQMINVYNLAPPSAVVSLALPFFCDRCNEGLDVTVAIAEARQRAGDTPPCPRCQRPMVFDDFPDSYLGWVDDHA
jgi:hypothetical protein